MARGFAKRSPFISLKAERSNARLVTANPEPCF